MSAINASLKITFDVLTDDRGDHWAALVEQIGTYVYGDDEASALKRADELIEFLVDSFRDNSTFQQFREYLDSHNIQHSVLAHNVTRDLPSPPFRYRREGRYAVAV